jgi:hypothetical protein
MSSAYAPRHFLYSSPSAVTHTIVHNLNALFPVVSVFEQGSGTFLVPQSIVVDNADQITITLVSSRAITGRVSE